MEESKTKKKWLQWWTDLRWQVDGVKSGFKQSNKLYVSYEILYEMLVHKIRRVKNVGGKVTAFILRVQRFR